MVDNLEICHPRQMKLRGFERLVTMVDNVSMKIVHSMLVNGDAKALLRFLPTALMQTFNTHPRMRAVQIEGQDFIAAIQEPLSLDDISNKNLLRVQEFYLPTQENFDNWQKYVEDECNVGFDRYKQLPFFLTVWVDEKAGQARLMLFSDHYMSDGYSGMVVLNDILEHIATLATQTSPTQTQELPLRPSFYDMWLSKKPLLKALYKGVIMMFGKTIFRNEMKKFQPVLPARADQHDFVIPPVSNSSTASFAEGNPTSMRKALVKCKDEGVTFGGAVVCATLLAFYHAARGLQRFDATQPFKLVIELDYNMRRRVPQPVQEDPVGTYVTFANLERLASEGVDLKTTKFWDLARQSKREIDSKVRETMSIAALPIIFDQQINAKTQLSFATALNIRHSQTSDVNLSNVGRYPFAKEYLLSLNNDCGSKKKLLEVKTLHVYNSMPHLGPSAVLWVSSVASFCYSMGHKCEDDSAKALFHAFVAVCESIGNIGADASMADVLGQLE
ncbi:hypothetical protein F444_21131 [Phytophthora nicotianae P1976]|uniref:Condensation domain-containing protein n=1 Tax=Phytophthora nicotianae P1976 TaxID=1317066 RepID=A0A080Z281_PHYNI|nr:hypothetical protein F444_21131 [Phytophthora nicotianae P1976]